MLTPIELIKATLDGMIAAPLRPHRQHHLDRGQGADRLLGLSNGARSGLTGFVAGLARKTVRHNVTINNLLPGAFDTDRLPPTSKAWRRTPRSLSRKRGNSAWPGCRRDGSARSRSLAPPAPGYAAPAPATSPGRIAGGRRRLSGNVLSGNPQIHEYGFAVPAQAGATIKIRCKAVSRPRRRRRTRRRASTGPGGSARLWTFPCRPRFRSRIGRHAA